MSWEPSLVSIIQKKELSHGDSLFHPLPGGVAASNAGWRSVFWMAVSHIIFLILVSIRLCLSIISLLAWIVSILYTCNINRLHE
jgi:hypothetical protein